MSSPFNGTEVPPEQALANLRVAITTWVEQALDYDGQGEAPRDAIAGAVGLGKTTVTLEVLAQLAQGKTMNFYAPTLELAAEVVSKATAIGLDAVMIRGREANKKDPARWPCQCQKADVAAVLGRVGRSVWRSLCRCKDKLTGNVSKCEFYYTCPYIRQFNQLEGKLIVLVHEYLALPMPDGLMPKPALVIVDEKFHDALARERSLPLAEVILQQPARPGFSDRVMADLAHDVHVAMQAVEAGRSMTAVGLTSKRLQFMAQLEEKLADVPEIWPDQPYHDQQDYARQLREAGDVFTRARLWRILAQDCERVTQRVVVRRGIEWEGEHQDRVFMYWRAEPRIGKGAALLLDADHDPIIGAATIPTNRRVVIPARMNVEVTQIGDDVCARGKLLTSAKRRADILALARREAAQGRKVLLGTYKPAAGLMRAEMLAAPTAVDANIDIVHFGAIRGLDGWKEFDSVIVAGREQPPPWKMEKRARALFGGDPDPLRLGGYVLKKHDYQMRKSMPIAVNVWVHPDRRVQSLLEQARECEIVQLVGRLRPVHRSTPARVFLLSNVPTSLTVDRLALWLAVIPGKLERALIAGRGVLPLSYVELARVHPGVWGTAGACRMWVQRNSAQISKKGIHPSLIFLYWNLCGVSQATLVSYRGPFAQCGPLCRALLPGRFEPAAMEPARELLVSVVGKIDQFQILDVILRPGVFEAAPDAQPEPFVFLGLRTIKRPADGIAPPDEFVIVPPRHGRPPMGAAA